LDGIKVWSVFFIPSFEIVLERGTRMKKADQTENPGINGFLSDTFFIRMNFEDRPGDPFFISMVSV
jgi:hypothetical protein